MQTGQHPRVTTEANIANMRRQLRALGLGHDPRRGVATTDVAYYRWTQWIFLQIFDSWYDDDADRARPIAELIAEFESGAREPLSEANPDGGPGPSSTTARAARVVDSYRLAYLDEAPVNWCPALGTVLANEEVTADGRSERGNHPVFRRPLKQWMLRITAYADRLLADLDLLDWPDSIKLMQRNWIGRSVGAEVDFPVEGHEDVEIEVFTTRPDTLFGATYMVLAPEHPLVDAIVPADWPDATSATTHRRPAAWRGIFGTRRLPGRGGAPLPRVRGAEERARAPGRGPARRPACSPARSRVNPVNGRRIPIFIADYVLMGYGTGAIMAVPAHDERDFEFAARVRPADRRAWCSRPTAGSRERGVDRRHAGRRVARGVRRRRRRR